MQEENGGPRRLLRGRVGRLYGLLVSSFTAAVIIGLSTYIVIRGQVRSYGEQDLPFLLSVLVGLMGLMALDWIIERKYALSSLKKTVDALAAGQQASVEAAQGLDRRIDKLSFDVSGIGSGANIGRFLESDVRIPHERLKRARKVLWSGVSLEYVLPLGLKDLEKAVKHRAEICILIADPYSDEVAADLRKRSGAKKDRLDGFLGSAMLNLQLLAMEVPDDFSFRLGFHQTFPSYGLLIIDPDDEDGICHVRLHHPDQQENCSFVLHATRDEYWFNVFVRQFREWESMAEVTRVSRPVDVGNGAQPQPSGDRTPAESGAEGPGEPAPDDRTGN